MRAQMKRMDTKAPSTSALAKPKLICAFGGSLDTLTARSEMAKPARSESRWAASDIIAREPAM